MSEPTTPAEIEERIAMRRRDLAATLDEIAVRVHPNTIVSEAKARVAATVDRTVGKAYMTVSRSVGGIRGQLVSPDGSPRVERVVPVALVAVAVVGLVVSVRRRR